MLCPYCSNDETKVTDKRDSKDETRRRRECLKCGKRFTTYEKIEPLEIFVIKKDGRREGFSREKLRNGIVKACEKRDVSLEKIDFVVGQIEEKLKQQGNEVESRIIGEMVMRALKKLDKVAYIRFASVYRDFQDVDDFKDVVREMTQ
ncbi:transcriptional regulator NrdR [Candidatus Woesearchaeota archaeon CG10_big_fil_rev_8_21_14_0_10_34_12]|nr:MAG: transcriptional regulator NrdR [Candidatus Woesearchaeota archaeon CG10_big_fil_rev_8_21_14_0_10_34_12]